MDMLKRSIILTAVLALGISTAAWAGQKETAVRGNETVKTSIQEQLERLEDGIIPTEPNDTVQLWAKAVKARNGALQYALFTENIKAGVKQSFEQFHWVTGASSPWVEKFKVTGQEEQKDKSILYTVEFKLATSNGKAGIDKAKVSLVQSGEQWLISSIAPADESAIGIWNTPESINEVNAEKHFKKTILFESKQGYQLRLPEDAAEKIKIEESACKNEEGNPPCIHFYYKDTKAQKNELLMTLIYLTKDQLNTPYYKDHPFLTFVEETGTGMIFQINQSEHPYAKNPDSDQAKEWDRLLNTLKEQL